MLSQSTLLPGRAILRLSGRDARGWLQNLVTNDVEHLGNGEARFAALLTPQGKILFDFFVVADGENLLLDCPSAQAAALAKRLLMYKLRADVAIAEAGSMLAAAAAWGGAPPKVSRAIVYADPRHESLGWRLIGEPQEFDMLGIEGASEAAYLAHRIACGVPQGGEDFAYGDTFPHEANMDMLHGVDFKKGCYVGQEGVSRVQHRGTARKRIVKVTFEGSSPARGTPVVAGDIAVGEMGSASPPFALASLRLDRAEDAKTAGIGLTADSIALQLAH